MVEYALVTPMAGRGSRFAREGFDLPKPLIDLEGRPYFWWATESVRRSAPVGEMVFVVLDEHVRDFAIDRRIRDYYPDAKVLTLPDVTDGAAETARLGLEGVSSSGPIAINDCDHAFRCPGVGEVLSVLGHDAAGALMCFRSGDPAYSYVRLDDSGDVAGTVEKRVASPFAIAGCYMFADRSTFVDVYDRYRESCPYDELFVSGVYNLLAARGDRLVKVDLIDHLSFGTPAERARITPDGFAPFASWI